MSEGSTDGMGYPPGWWIASDGNYYPPEMHPDHQGQAKASPALVKESVYDFVALKPIPPQGGAAESGGDVPTRAEGSGDLPGLDAVLAGEPAQATAAPSTNFAAEFATLQSETAAAPASAAAPATGDSHQTPEVFITAGKKGRRGRRVLFGSRRQADAGPALLAPVQAGAEEPWERPRDPGFGEAPIAGEDRRWEASVGSGFDDCRPGLAGTA